MRFGTYAVHFGNEFEVTKLENGRFKLISRDRFIDGLGFTQSQFLGGYTKIVNRNEIETAYSVSMRAIYKGYEFQIIDERGNEVLITTSDTSVCEKLGMEARDRWDYRMWVSKVDLDRIWEVKKSIYDFK